MKAIAQMGGLDTVLMHALDLAEQSKGRTDNEGFLARQLIRLADSQSSLESVRSEALDLRQFVNAADISGCDAPHEVIEKLQLVINVAALKREPNAALSPARVAEGRSVDPEFEHEPPETQGTWQERCSALYQVIGCMANMFGIFETSDDVSDALDVAAGRGDVEHLLPWPKIDLTTLVKAPESPAKEQPGEQKWIPVSERLPEHGVVLAVTADGQIDMYQWNLIADYANDPDPNARLTHWMPLPPPPEHPWRAVEDRLAPDEQKDRP